MSDEAWKQLLQGVGGGACFSAFVALVVAFFRFVGSGRKQDHEEIKRLTARVESLEKKHEDCLKNEAKLLVEMATLKAMMVRIEANSGTAIVVSDDQGIILEWNPAATSMFGWSTVEAVGRHVSILVPLRLRERHDSSFHKAVMENRGPNPEAAARIRESYALTKNGEEIPVTITLLGWAYEGKRLYSAEIKRR